jgi:hypothetical protein
MCSAGFSWVLSADFYDDETTYEHSSQRTNEKEGLIFL